MKAVKTLFLIIVFTIVASVAPAEPGKSLVGKWYSVTTSGLSAEAVPDFLDMTIGFKCLVYSSADDSITVTITASDGTTPIWTDSTTSGSSGEWLDLSAIPIPQNAKIAISGVGSGTASVWITAKKF